jgi:hypothetical protein
MASSIATGLTRFVVVHVPTPANAEASIAEASRTEVGPSSAVRVDVMHCSWLDGTPEVPIPVSGRKSPSTSCDPIIPGRAFGLVEADQNSSFQYGVLRVARLNPTTHRISVGPVIVTFAQGSGGWPVIVEGDGSIWAYCPSTSGSTVLRFSAANGVLLQEITIPSVPRPEIAANSDGLFLGESNQGGSTPGIYFVPVGASQDELIQATKDFVFMMQATGHSMTVIEAPYAAGPFEEYRFTAIAK